MAFNTLQFVYFFVIVYAVYLFLRPKWQNLLLLAASYFFYSWWDWRFLGLLLLSTAVNFYAGKVIFEGKNQKRTLVLAVIFNIGMLCVFKYYSFFVDSFYFLLWGAGIKAAKPVLHIILPLGISFYTFQAMSYPIDIYRGMIKPTPKISDFALFIAFFPQLIAGPIERARNLIPQIVSRREITPERVKEGIWLCFYGMYKKIVIADNLSKLTSPMITSWGQLSFSEVVFLAYTFAIQLYCDFSGYSDVARGLGRMFGFEIMINFRNPFFSNNVYDLWQRWHISLTTWIKEYIYYPLGLATIKGRAIPAPVVVLITWSIMGLWHGPEARFLWWGIFHATAIILYSKAKPFLSDINIRQEWLRRTVNAFNIFAVFNIFCAGILFFALGQNYPATEIFRWLSLNFTAPFRVHAGIIVAMLFIMLPWFFIEYSQYKEDSDLAVFTWPTASRALIYIWLFYLIFIYGQFYAKQYYYFQF